jgi:hypothetical protein
MFVFAFARFDDLSAFGLTGADAWAAISPSTGSLCTGARR